MTTDAGLGWPNEWDPIAEGDDCIMSWGALHHPVQAPYERFGSGYACTDCIDQETQP